MSVFPTCKCDLIRLLISVRPIILSGDYGQWAATVKKYAGSFGGAEALKSDLLMICAQPLKKSPHRRHPTSGCRVTRSNPKRAPLNHVYSRVPDLQN